MQVGSIVQCPVTKAKWSNAIWPDDNDYEFLRSICADIIVVNYPSIKIKRDLEYTSIAKLLEYNLKEQFNQTYEEYFTKVLPDKKKLTKAADYTYNEHHKGINNQRLVLILISLDLKVGTFFLPI